MLLYAIKVHREGQNIEKIKVCKFKDKNDSFDVDISELIKYIESSKIILWCTDIKQGFNNLSLIHPAYKDNGAKYLMTSCDLFATNNLENLPEF